MRLPEERQINVETFYKMREATDQLLEYVNGIVYMSPSPSTQHQRVSSRLQAALFNFLDGENCEVFTAPYDIHLYRDDIDETVIFIPDLTVICDSEELEENKFVGVPEIIVEILSPSNQSHDLVTKMEAYMKYGVKEYWVVNPMLNAVQVYALTDEQVYQQVDILKGRCCGIKCTERVSNFVERTFSVRLPPALSKKSLMPKNYRTSGVFYLKLASSP